MDFNTLFKIIEIVNIVGFAGAIIYLFKIRSLIKGYKKIWEILAMAFLLLLITRSLGIFSFTNSQFYESFKTHVFPFIFLLSSLLFFMGIWLLHKVLKEAKRKTSHLKNFVKK